MAKNYGFLPNPDCIDSLNKMLPFGTIIYGVKRHRTGSSTWVSFFVVHKGKIVDLDWTISQVINTWARNSERYDGFRFYHAVGDGSQMVTSLSKFLHGNSDALKFAWL